MIEEKVFGRLSDGSEVVSYTLWDGQSYARILNYGATIQSIVVPDKEGNMVDVVLGYNEVEPYEKNGGCLGATIGRFANRIQDGKLSIDGQTYSLNRNKKGNHIHGGVVGFHKKIWTGEIQGDTLILSLFSPDGDERYPGNLTVRVAFTFQNGELKLRYSALSDKKTAINLTNHAYFNLDGEQSGDIRKNVLWLDSDTFTPTDENGLPTGAFRAVKDTPFDFNVMKPIGKDIDCEDIDLKLGNGYDHCYVLKNTGKKYVEYAVAKSEKTGIKMRCYTDMPAVQLYTGNYLHQTGKSGEYQKHSGFCLETQAIPNNVNVPAYAEKGSSIYAAGEEYTFTAAYAFIVDTK